jgi:hypothetical protein
MAGTTNDDETQHGRSTWKRLRDKEYHLGRESHWFYSAWSPLDDDEDILLRHRKEWALTFAREHRDHVRKSPATSTSEEQTWTIFLPAEDMDPGGGRAGCRDYVVEAVGLAIAEQCGQGSSLNIKVEIAYTGMKIQVIDLDMRHDRRVRSCKNACVALLLLARKSRGTFKSKGFTLVADQLWKEHVRSEGWDKIKVWTRISATASGRKKLKMA